MPKKEKPPKEAKVEPARFLKSQFHQWIIDLNRTLAAERQKTREVETDYLATEKKWDQQRQDSAEIVAFINEQLQLKQDEIAGYDERIAMLLKEIRVQDQYFKEIFVRMEDEYKVMKERLSDDIAFVTAKIKVMKEYKAGRDQWLERMAQAEQELVEQEVRHKEELYEADKKSIVDQHINKTNMDTKLYRLERDMSEAMNVRVGSMANKFLKRNIDLGNELTCLQELTNKLMTAFVETTAAAKESKYALELQGDEYKITRKKYLSLVETIEKLLQRQDALRGRLAELDLMVKANRRLKRRITEVECESGLLGERLVGLRQAAAERQLTVAEVKAHYRTLQRVVIKMELALFEVAKVVKEAADMTPRWEALETKQPTAPHAKRQTAEDEEMMERKRIDMWDRREKLIKSLPELLAAGKLTEEERQLMGCSLAGTASGQALQGHQTSSAMLRSPVLHKDVP